MRVLLLIIIGEEKRKRRAGLILLYRFPSKNNDLSTSFVSDLVIVSQSAATAAHVQVSCFEMIKLFQEMDTFLSLDV
jgi:hypothetical protein